MNAQRSRMVLLVFLLTLSAAESGAVPQVKPEILYKTALPSIMTLKAMKPDGSLVLGSAFILSDSGVAATAWHLVNGATDVSVRFSDGEEFEVSGLIDKDEKRDLALVRVKAFGRPELKPNTNTPDVGSRAYVIGAPRGLEFTISEGLVSQVQQIDGMKQYQFSCPASPGNSGGPLLNDVGDVIGVVSWQLTNGQNLNFAIPAVFLAGLDKTLPTTPWDTLRSTRADAPKQTSLPRMQTAEIKTFQDSKTIYVKQSGGNPELLVSVEKELRKWGRFTTVGSSDDADLILDLAPTANPQLLLGKGAKAAAILSRPDGVRLWSVVKGGDWSMAGYTFGKVGKAIADDLKKFAKQQK